MRIKLGNDYEKKQNSPFCHHHREILVVISAFFGGRGYTCTYRRGTAFILLPFNLLVWGCWIPGNLKIQSFIHAFSMCVLGVQQ